MIVVILVLAGLITAIWRRLIKPTPRPVSARTARRRQQSTTDEVVEMAPEPASAPEASPVYSTDLSIMQRRVAEAEANAKVGLYDSIVALVIGIKIALAIGILLTMTIALTNRSLMMIPVIIIDLVIAGAIVYYTLLSLHKIETRDLTILLVFGKYVKRLQPGLVYAPEWICDVVGHTTEEIEFDLPDAEGNVFNGDLKDVGGILPRGMVMAEYVNLSQGIIPEGQDYLSIKGRKLMEDGTYKDGEEIGKVSRDDFYLDAQPVRVTYSIGIVIEDILALYLAKGLEIDKVIESISDQALPRFNEVLVRMCPAEARIRTNESSSEVMRSLIDFTQNWGVRTTMAKIKKLDFSHEFNTKVSRSAAAKPEKAEVIVRSQGVKVARENEGAGEGAYERNRLTGIADGQKKLIEASNADGGRTQAIQAVADALGKSQLIVSDPQNILGAVASVGAVISKFPTKVPPTPAEPTTKESAVEKKKESRIILTDGDNPRSQQEHRKPTSGKGGRQRKQA